MKQVQDIQIFCSYAHEDRSFARYLKTHFAPLERLKSWVFWTDMELRAGEEWESIIQGHLDTAQVILLLVSPDFMASDYCYSKEMQRAIERHEQKEAYVIPIIVRPVAHWKDTPLGKLQALPADGKPVIDRDWQTPDHAFTHVVEKISHTIGMLRGKNQRDATKSVPTQAKPEQSPMIALPPPEPHTSARGRVGEGAGRVKGTSIRLFEHQEDAYDLLLSLIRRYGAKEAVLIQYSCQSSMPVLRKLLRAGAEVTVFIQHEETAAKVGSQFQADRIIRTTRSLRSDLGDALVEPDKLKVYKYHPPCSMSAIKIDNQILYMGWYTYEQKTPAGQGAYSEDTIDFSGHDRAAVVIWKGAGDFQKFVKTFNVLEQNYRQYAEIVSI